MKIYDLRKNEQLEDFFSERLSFGKKEYFSSQAVRNSVSEIIEQVATKGDAALRECTKRFDNVDLQDIEASEDEIQESIEIVDDNFKLSFEKAVENIFSYHKKQFCGNDWIELNNGYYWGEKFSSIKNVGAYIPGGSAPLVSTLMMICIPAKIAGVENIYVTTPPSEKGKINPFILYACHKLGVEKIYKIGGAQAIAALAFGTETVKKVDKICGPGNKYVTEAKRQVFGFVGIDMLAGPSEVCIIADETANPDFISVDILSQAEHDPESISILITNSENIAMSVAEKVEQLYKTDERFEILKQSLEKSFIVISRNINEAIDIANEIAPEHLEVHIDDAENFCKDMHLIAGAVFVGSYSPVVIGDLFAGPNHILPTSGRARFFNPLAVSDFVRRNSIIMYSKEKLYSVGDFISKIAEVEKLPWHKNSVMERLKERSS